MEIRNVSNAWQASLTLYLRFSALRHILQAIFQCSYRTKILSSAGYHLFHISVFEQACSSRHLLPNLGSISYRHSVNLSYLVAHGLGAFPELTAPHAQHLWFKKVFKELLLASTDLG